MSISLDQMHGRVGEQRSDQAGHKVASPLHQVRVEEGQHVAGDDV